MHLVLNLPLEPQIEKTFRRLLAAIGEPWKPAKTGRPPKRRPREYALALFCRAFWKWSFREAECILKIPKTCLQWASRRLQSAWVSALIERTAERLRSACKVKCAILDSTGVSVRGFGFKRRFQRRPYWKLHAIAEYAPRAHKIWFAAAKATRGFVHDVVAGRQLLEKAPPADLYGDMAYDDKKLFRLALRLGFRPCMQQRKNSASRRGIRGVIWRNYDDAKRRKYRGRIEAMFGGFANRYCSAISEKKTSTRRRACLLWAVAHNVRTMAKRFELLMGQTRKNGRFLFAENITLSAGAGENFGRFSVNPKGDFRMKEITVVAKDRIGLLADISEMLEKNGVHMESVSVEASNRTAIIRIVTKQYEAAKRILEKQDFKVMDVDILVVKLTENGGELAKLSRALADAKISIENVLMLNKEGNETLFALKISNYEGAKKVLKKYL